MKLSELRKAVDRVDDQVLALLNKRANLTKKIGALKAKRNEGVYVPDREKQIYRRLTRQNSGPLSEKSIKAIYREIMSSSLGLEKGVSIAYLGPELTFTHLASLKKFGSSVNYLSCDSITDVFTEVERERADYGVVPIENSIEGAVNHTLDMFIDSELKICSEVFLEVSHNLLSKESDRRNIKRIYSNPQVFGQCRVWLETNLPKMELVEVSSTARAAEIASQERRSACIASALAAERYGLKTLCCSIEDNSSNVTRFLVIGKIVARPTDRDKTSIMFTMKDKAGALHDVLVPFKRSNISLTKIESRPSKIKPWKYYFFCGYGGSLFKCRCYESPEPAERKDHLS